MIASESTAPTEVLELSGSVLPIKQRKAIRAPAFKLALRGPIKLKTWRDRAKLSLAQIMSTHSPTHKPQLLCSHPGTKPGDRC